jgi:prepilin-type N-terminal cleavage/methylation domain-containing protein
MSRRRDIAGFTLVELLLALSLLSILMIALVNLIDTSMRIWSRTEAQRDLSETSAAVAELLARDLAGLEAGPRGDLLCDWWTFDIDGDQTPGVPFARLRLVKRPSRAELERSFPGADSDLVEVVWALLPNPAGTASAPRTGAAASAPADIGLLVRGERLVGDDDRVSFFDDRFFNAGGKPPGGATQLVTGGLLWFELDFASQTSCVNDGWTVGEKAEDAATSWDAWARGRPDRARSMFNAPAAALPSPDAEPILPRRVQIRMEIERIDDLKRRARLSEPLETEATTLVVDDAMRAPRPGAMILVDEEWMEVQSIAGARLSVHRGARGTPARQHGAGTVIHHGWAMMREVLVPLYRDDWDL